MAGGTQAGVQKGKGGAPKDKSEIWGIIGVLLTVVTATAAATAWILHAVDSRPAKVASPISLQASLQQALGQVQGEILYASFLKRFDQRKTFLAYKTALTYDITISDSPPPGTPLSQPLQSGSYYFVSCVVDFTRVSGVAPTEIGVSAMTSLVKLPDSIDKRDVVIHEIIGINPGEQAWVNQLVSTIDKAPTTDERASLFQSLFPSRCELDGLTARVTEVRKEAYGYSVSYGIPRNHDWTTPLHYRFEYTFTQPRTEKSFPIIVAEPTLGYLATFRFSNAPSIKEAKYFAAFPIGPSPRNPLTDLDPTNRILQVRAMEGEWLLPFGGVFVYWTE